MTTDDPTATYRGYRRQALYALFRLFDDALPGGSVIQPEGHEDLAIFDAAGSLVEVVQVKDHSDNLAASSFKPSFYERIAPHCVPGSTTIVRIASFGQIGPDIQNAVSADAAATTRVLKTLTKSRTKERKLADGTTKTITIPGLPAPAAKNVVSHLTLTTVNENDLTNAVVGALAKTVTGVDPNHAFDFLMWWLLTSSETQLRIDRQKAIAKVGRIGKFLSQRAAYHDEWHTSIIPIESPDKADDRDPQLLAEEFYRGGRVRFEHVHADLDVPRNRFLMEIHAAFIRENVVIIHSASGQGKTTLAYRYAKEFAPSEFRFEIATPSNLKHARRLALALVGHAEAVEVPTLVFLDVRPGDAFWGEVVRQLASVTGIRVLVTIREEDWSQARISAADFPFAEVALEFERDEADQLYARLTAGLDQERHLDFDDAWSQFGNRKTLLEFAYYVTQEESLADRIHSQIETLQDAVLRGDRGAGELELLRLVAVASAYEARLNLEKLVDNCELADPQRTLERFNDEYLIRVSEDGRHVEGFHSIRSEIIADKLTDPVVCPWSKIASESLPLVVEVDLQSFLLFAFSRHADASKTLISALQSFRPRTWVGVNGVATSLMWNGIREYSERNSALLHEVFDRVRTGWWATLDWDLGQLCGKEGFLVFEHLKHISAEAAKAAEYASSSRARQSDKDSVFADVKNWLREFSSQPTSPDGPKNFSAMAELLFWVGHIDIETSLSDAITADVINKALEELPIYLLGEFILGIRTCNSKVYDEWLMRKRDELLNHLRREAAIAHLYVDDESVVAHYAIDLDRQASALRRNSAESSSAKATIHDLTIERVELLNRLLPGKQRYGAVGYGHRTSLVALPFDDADKPGVLANNLHPIWPPRFNALARGYAERRFRPKTWLEYFETLQSIREEVLVALDDLKQATTALRQSSAPKDTLPLQRPTDWDNCRKQLNGELLLPIVAVDEWGFMTDTKSDRSERDTRSERYSGLVRFTPVRKAVSEYTRTVENFMSQALDCLLLVPNLRAAQTQADREKLLKAAAEHGISERSVDLSIVNGVDACAAVDQLQLATREVFGDMQLPGADAEFCKKERTNFMSTVTSWCVFLGTGAGKHSGRTSGKKQRRQRKNSRKPDGIAGLLKPTRNRVKDALRSLQKEGIKAAILSEDLPWNGSSALWISCDTMHPLATLIAIEKVWHKLVAAFEPDRNKTVRLKSIDLTWSEIVLVPLVNGKSLERQAIPHLKAVTYPEVPDLQQSSWRLFPDGIPDDAWAMLTLDSWEVHPSWSVFDRFAAAYGMLFQHVDHMSDFQRLPNNLDDAGLSILQSYIDHETTRSQPLFQGVLDTCTELLAAFPEIDDGVDASRPNIRDCLQLLLDMKDAIYPTPDFQEHAKLSIDDVVNWRDRLEAGMQNLGVVRQLWIADSLSLGAVPELGEIGCGDSTMPM